MNFFLVRKLSFSIFFLLTLLLTTSWVQAKEKYAKKEQVKCIHCHENKYGGGPRNETGLYYQATKTLPTNKSLAEIKDTVEAYIQKVSQHPPQVVWDYTPLSQLKDQPAPQYQKAAPEQIIRRLSLDLRGIPPEPKEIEQFSHGKVSLKQKTEEYLSSKEFTRTFRLYHRDILRPRSGIHNLEPSYTLLKKKNLQGRTVYYSSKLKNEWEQGLCQPDKTIRVSPYWDRKNEIEVCQKTAKTELRVTINPKGKTKQIRCDRESGQDTGECGCGPNLVFCYPQELKLKEFHRDMTHESSRVAMKIVNDNRPYSDLLTADWTLLNGKLEYFYARLTGHLNKIKNPDLSKPWRKINRPERHSGVLSSPSYLNFFFNGRRWAQRTFEAFMCHNVFPDFDLLDEHAKNPPVSYRAHPTWPADINVNSGRACAACHIQLDGLARVKDQWDWYGMYYPQRKVPKTISFLGEKITGLDAFGKALAQSEVFHDCVTNQVWEHMTGHRFHDNEVKLRKKLVKDFEKSNLNFKDLLRAVIESAAYQSKDNLKLMNRELYIQTFEKLTGSRWKVKNRRGFDVFYDKVGGMDYRKIEKRDQTPSQGHSMVLLKGASETCESAIDSEWKKPQKLLASVKNYQNKLNQPQIKLLIKDWSLAFYARLPKNLNNEEVKILENLFLDNQKQHGTKTAYKALCTTMLASEEFALF